MHAVKDKVSESIRVHREIRSVRSLIIDAIEQMGQDATKDELEEQILTRPQQMSWIKRSGDILVADMDLSQKSEYMSDMGMLSIAYAGSVSPVALEREFQDALDVAYPNRYGSFGLDLVAVDDYRHRLLLPVDQSEHERKVIDHCQIYRDYRNWRPVYYLLYKCGFKSHLSVKDDNVHAYVFQAGIPVARVALVGNKAGIIKVMIFPLYRFTACDDRTGLRIKSMINATFSRRLFSELAVEYTYDSTLGLFIMRTECNMVAKHLEQAIHGLTNEMVSIGQMVHYAIQQIMEQESEGGMT